MNNRCDIENLRPIGVFVNEIEDCSDNLESALVGVTLKTNMPISLPIFLGVTRKCLVTTTS